MITTLDNKIWDKKEILDNIDIFNYDFNKDIYHNINIFKQILSK